MLRKSTLPLFNWRRSLFYWDYGRSREKDRPLSSGPAKAAGGGGVRGGDVAREMVARVGVKDKSIPIKQSLWNSSKNQAKDLDIKGEGRW